jgi:glycosyltransferase involved in cell wall biosynthesis
MRTFILYNQSRKQLRNKLQHIFSGAGDQDFEVVYLDNATKDGAWDVANEFADRYPGKLTLSRGAKRWDRSFLRSFAQHLSSDKDGAKLAKRDESAAKKKKKFIRPLVSIVVYNYNYGRFLKKCLSSIFEQTYPHIEVAFSDNGSSDDSWKIALEFAKKYPGRMTLTRNRENFGPFKNFVNCQMTQTGDLRIELGSDDYLRADCVEKCVDAFRHNRDVGFVMYHRDIVDFDGQITPEVPFYDGSFLIDGVEQAAVYLMASVNPSMSQVCYDSSIKLRPSDETPLSRWWGNRITDFTICLNFRIAYIAEPLLGHRVHNENDSKYTEATLLEIFGPYLLNVYFVELARNQLAAGSEIIAERLGPSIKKLATLSLRYASRALLRNEAVLAKQYFYLSRALDENITESPVFQLLERLFGGKAEMTDILAELATIPQNVARTTSYPPPKGSLPLQLAGKRKS